DQPPPEAPRRGQRGGNLRWMMAVVVDDENVVRLAANLESAFHAAKDLQPGPDAFERQPDLEADGHSREGVLQIVPARHLQREGAEDGRLRRVSRPPAAPLDDRANAERLEL